jgi:glycosyltransferase involved in cell wall biosynthesis
MAHTMSMRVDNHTFVIPAFREPAWLDRCLDSLHQQTNRSPVVMTTSTPNEFIAATARRHAVPLVINPTRNGIAEDWNFALTQASTQWVTLAHQDDWYAPDYVECCLAAAKQAANAILIFTAARECVAGDARMVANARMKRVIAALAFATSSSIESAFRRRLLLSFGNPIPCPSVMLNRQAVPNFRFADGWKSNLDWSAWLRLVREPGAFVYVRQPLVHRTVHADAATTQHLSDRAREDRRMFEQLWPAPIAAALDLVYAASRRPYRQFERS